MEFWNIFAQESLQKPWVIGSEAAALVLVEPPQKKVFIVPPGTRDELYSMVTKMIYALKYKASDVGLVEVSVSQVDELSDWSEGKQLLFFGEDFPGSFGDFVNLHGSVVMRTHSLEELDKNPALKKITWAHLKKYAVGLPTVTD